MIKWLKDFWDKWFKSRPHDPAPVVVVVESPAPAPAIPVLTEVIEPGHSAMAVWLQEEAAVVTAGPLEPEMMELAMTIFNQQQYTEMAEADVRNCMREVVLVLTSKSEAI